MAHSNSEGNEYKLPNPRANIGGNVDDAGKNVNYFPAYYQRIPPVTWFHDSQDPKLSVHPCGVIILNQNHGVQIEIGLNQSVRITNAEYGITLTISSCGNFATMKHPNGIVFRHGQEVDLLAYNNIGDHIFAEIWKGGISFSTKFCPFVYLLDNKGVRTKVNEYQNQEMGISENVFPGEPSYKGPENSVIDLALKVIENSDIFSFANGKREWIINNIRISQDTDGLICVHRHDCSLSTSPKDGSAAIDSSNVYCKGTMGYRRYLTVSKHDRHIHYNGLDFTVINAGKSSGLDARHKLKGS